MAHGRPTLRSVRGKYGPTDTVDGIWGNRKNSKRFVLVQTEASDMGMGWGTRQMVPGHYSTLARPRVHGPCNHQHETHTFLKDGTPSSEAPLELDFRWRAGPLPLQLAHRGQLLRAPTPPSSTLGLFPHR